jgi:sodium-dependent phosphate transporter
VPKKQPSPSP